MKQINENEVWDCNHTQPYKKKKKKTSDQISM